MAGTDPLFLSPGARRELLNQLARLEARMASVRLRTMAVSDDLASAEGARDVAALLTHDTPGTPPPTGASWRCPRPSSGAGPPWQPRWPRATSTSHRRS